MRITRPRTSFAFAFVVCFELGLGLLRLAESPNRYRGDAYIGAKSAMPIRVWGVAFVVLALILLAALRYVDRPNHSSVRRLVPFVAATVLNFATLLLWGALSAQTARDTGRTSYGGAFVYASVAIVLCVAAWRER